MGAKQSTSTQSSTEEVSTHAGNNAAANRRRTLSGSNRDVGGYGPPQSANVGGPSPPDSRQRARSLSYVPMGQHAAMGIGIPATLASGIGGIFDISGTPDSDGSSTPDDTGAITVGTNIFGTRVYAAHSLPTQLSSAFNGIKCPVCSKFVIPDDIECHLVMCLTKPRISYNEDILREDKGECVICLDDLKQGDTIARLPCLCIYHKSCIDSWFEVNRSCPEHPLD